MLKEITVLFVENGWVERVSGHDKFTDAFVRVLSKDWIFIQKDNGEGRVGFSWDEWIDISAFIEKELDKLTGKDAKFNSD